jgi:hypothetical protein
VKATVATASKLGDCGADHIRHRHSAFNFLQHRVDLGLGESGLSHVASE